MITLFPLVRFESICTRYSRIVPPPNNYGFLRTMNVKNCKKRRADRPPSTRKLKGRLAQPGAKLDLSEHGIVCHALRAAVNAIEANDYKIELPLKIALAKAPIESQVRAAQRSGDLLYSINRRLDIERFRASERQPYRCAKV
jgi:hypothetical protein